MIGKIERKLRVAVVSSECEQHEVHEVSMLITLVYYSDPIARYA